MSSSNSVRKEISLDSKPHTSGRNTRNDKSCANELLERAKAGDLSARDQFLRMNVGLAYMAVRRWAAGCDQEEALAAAMRGLNDAIDRCDLGKGAFSTMAVMRMRYELHRTVYPYKAAVSVRIHSGRANASQRARAYQAQRSTFSIDAVRAAKEARDTGPDVDHILGSAMPKDTFDAQEVWRLMAGVLSDDEQHIVRRRFVDGAKFTEIAREVRCKNGRLGMSSVSVGIRLRTALRKLRRAFAERPIKRAV